MGKIDYVNNGVYEAYKKAHVVEDGKYVKLKKAFIVEDGKYVKLWSSGVDAGEVVLTASQEWTVPEGVKTIDIFCVGGGGGGGGYYIRLIGNNGGTSDYYYFGAGGGGGYTATLLDVPVTPGETLDVIVGAAGVAGEPKFYQTFDGEVYENSGTLTNGGTGGVSSVNRGTTALITADGGVGGRYSSSTTLSTGGKGGSGGGSTGYETTTINYNTGQQTSTVIVPSEGGVDGANSKTTTTKRYYSTLNNTVTDETTEVTVSSYAKGQGSTTRYFGESEGTLYASGGGAGILEVANSGNGGGTIGVDMGGNFDIANASSGVVIIRWHEQED